MDDIRKGQIALLFLKRQLSEKGVRLTSNFKFEIENATKAINISMDEAMEFAEGMVRELVEEIFAKPPHPEE